MKLKLLAAALLALALPTVALAFPDHDIDFVIPYNPGGGNDAIVRMIAPVMEQHLEGGHAVVPKNVAGAGGQKGTATVYRAKPDGYTIGLVPMPGMALPALLGDPVQYDINKFTWLGRIEASYYVLVVPASSGITSLDQLKGRKVTFLSTGFGSTMLVASQLTAAALGLDADFVTGYQSSAEAMVGLMRGDGDVAIGIIEPTAGYVQSGDMVALAASAKREALPDVKTFAEEGYPELMSLSLERWVAGPPDMDPEAKAVLQQAFDAALADPAFQKAADQAQIVLAPLSGDKASSAIADLTSILEKYKDQLGNPAH